LVAAPGGGLATAGFGSGVPGGVCGGVVGTLTVPGMGEPAGALVPGTGELPGGNTTTLPGDR
jgi:hypothetical protein